MKNLFLRLKNTFISENLYLALQLLFSWAFFKILGFIGISLPIRLFLSIIFLVVLFNYWAFLIGYIVNTFLFQFYLFTTLHIINLLIRFRNLTFFLAFSLSLYYSITGKILSTLCINETTIFLGRSELLFFLLFLHGFVKTLCDHVFYKEMEKRFYVCIASPEEFSWVWVVQLLNSIWHPHVEMKNKIHPSCLLLQPFLNFPFTYGFLQELSKAENNWMTFFTLVGTFYVEANMENLKIYDGFRVKRAENLTKFIVEHKERNNKFYNLIMFSFCLGFVVGTFYLNFIFHFN